MSRRFFVADLAGVKSYLPAFLGAIGAVVIVALDTMLWLSICFALAGPMILSGLYEALLDSRVIDFVREKTINRNLTLDMRCRLLMVVLIGNLDLAVEDDHLITADLRRGHAPRHMVIAGSRPSQDNTLGQTSNPSASMDGRDPSAHLQRDEAHARGSLEVELDKNGPDIRLEQMHGSENQDASLHADHSSSSINNAQTQPRASTANTQRQECAHADVTVVQRRSTAHLKASPWRHMEELLYPIRLYDDGNTSSRDLSPRQYPKQWHRDANSDGLCPDRSTCNRPDHVQTEQPKCRTPTTDKQVRKTQTRLRTMLNCQYSFGSMVGAPVLFFLGGFVFALLQSLQDLGSEDIALALAFGQFYMTVPHIAIVSGLLLAGNNPNILEGVFATQRGHHDVGDETGSKRPPGRLTFGLAYPSCYKVAWQWHRGHNKRQWIKLLIDTYSQRGEQGQWNRAQLHIQDDNLEDLRTLEEKTTPSTLDWFLILAMTGLLLGVPFLLAFVTAYYTPEVGISCRSFTFICYAVSQFGQITLWLWEVSIFTYYPNYANSLSRPKHEQRVQAQGREKEGDDKAKSINLT